MYRRYESIREYNHCNCKNEALEDICDSVYDNDCLSDNDDEICKCGFEEEMSLFPENPMLAQSYVPIQYMDKTFLPCCGLKMGTIFPELVSPYKPGQSMEEIKYLKSRNEIREGCNK